MAHSPELQRFYASRPWRDLRARLIAERLGTCERCGKSFADTSQLICHHKIHLTDETLTDPAVALDPANIEVLCPSCHAFYHTERGYIHSSRQVFIVYGPPLSGKSTYVRQNMQRGDLVVDYDQLYRAVSLCPLYDRPDELRRVTFALRDCLLDQVRTRNGTWSTAWIIAGLPRKLERERLAARLGASLIYIEATESECLARLESVTDLRASLPWADYTRAWFRDYTP